jgi:heme A synthase
MMGFLIRLWPIWVLAVVLVMWRLWHLRAKGEGHPESTAAERKRWKNALIGLMAFAVVAVVGAALTSRPQDGAYHPVEMDADGNLTRATIGGDATNE